ncbi:glycerophosphodiester phosphodiesterase [Thiotrichales bacterium 19S9-12]|nr:glycerophosphodiester phosphodiesterase [Thiotrichales bacterium 19S9-11]MCF6812427.1 glycerophosphodiester phosphodiesterase [Thiotrichales bacterium 19S9-12]
MSDSEVVQYNGKPTPSNVVEIYAHRGGRGLYPENTLQAYNSVLNVGIDYVDMDVGMTKDGVVVVTHDLGLDPDITKKNGQHIKKAIPIYELTYQDLQAYDVGQIKPDSEYATYFPDQISAVNTKIPTLKEVITYVKSIAGERVGFQIEIKTDPKKPNETASPQEFVAGVYQVLKETGVINRTEVQAFDFRCLIALQKLDSNIKTAYLTDYDTNPTSGPNKTLWTAGYDVSDYDGSFPKMIKALGGSIWGPYEMDLTKEQLDQAHKLGVKVVVWGWPEDEGTEFNLKKIKEIINWGVDGIITDRPDRLRALLSSLEYKVPKRIGA